LIDIDNFSPFNSNVIMSSLVTNLNYSSTAQEIVNWVTTADNVYWAIGVGTQSTLGATHFCPKMYVSKMNKMPDISFSNDDWPKNIFTIFFGGGRRGARILLPP